MRSGWLIDKSALVRLGASPDAEEWIDRVARGLVRITTMTRLEVGFSARNGADARRVLRGPVMSQLIVEHLTPAVEDRASEVQLLLADLGQHRAPSVPDLLISATAELAGLTVLHLDKDFELISSITAQPVERLRIPG